MTLNQILDIIPETTRIRLREAGNALNVIYDLVYSDSLRNGASDLLQATVCSISASIQYGDAYLVISINL